MVPTKLKMPQHYTVHPDKILAGEYPGSRDDKEAALKLSSLLKKGVRVFLDLTTPEDNLKSYKPILEEVSHTCGIQTKHLSMPIPDRNIPRSKEDMVKIMETIQKAVTSGEMVYIHCRGGIGRTGTVIGCWLVECGNEPETAVETVQKNYSGNMPKASRAPFSPETPEQKQYILKWRKSLHQPIQQEKKYSSREKAWATLSEIERETWFNLPEKLTADPDFAQLKKQVDQKKTGGRAYQSDPLLLGLYLTTGNPLAAKIAQRLGITIKEPSQKSLFSRQYLEIPIPPEVKLAGIDPPPVPGTPVILVGSPNYAGAYPRKIKGYRSAHSWRAGNPLNASPYDTQIVEVSGWITTGGPRLFPCPFCKSTAGITSAPSSGWPSQKAVICNNNHCGCCIEEIFQGPPLIALWNNRPF